MPLEERLRKRLVENENGCWIFQGCTKERYGKIKPGNNVRQSIGAHRAAYMVWVGEIPDGMVVCHSCDVPKCCNPSHLFIGTHADNISDRDNKGRHWVPQGTDSPHFKHGKYSLYAPSSNK